MDIKNSKYYKIAGNASCGGNHPSDKCICNIGSKSQKILDLGCGEGTRLNKIPNSKAEKVGVDISKLAISLCKSNYPNIKSKVVKTKLPFKNNSFDFVYSAFVLEHTKKTEEFLKEAVRVLSNNGIILFVAPNFGSPNRISPNGKYNRLTKILFGYLEDLKFISNNNVDSLNWQKVVPQKRYSKIDADTTIEPYLLSLEKYMNSLGVKKILSSSLWSEEKKGFSFQSFFRILASLNLYPFMYWGPHLLYIGKKHD